MMVNRCFQSALPFVTMKAKQKRTRNQQVAVSPNMTYWENRTPVPVYEFTRQQSIWILMGGLAVTVAAILVAIL